MAPLDTYREAADYLTIIRDLIKHENDLVNHRLSWLFTLQGLLFAATSFLWKASMPPVIIFGIVGVISCISIGYTIACGLNAIIDLIDLAKKNTGHIPDALTFNPIIGSQHPTMRWIQASKLLPWVLGIAWIFILIIRITNLSQYGLIFS